MEPDIIRMYSSSPPPLDNGAEEEEEDEFGDFGDFSGAGSTVGFDCVSSYSSSKEEHKCSYNSDYSGSVDSIIAFNTVKCANDKDNTIEPPISIKGVPDSSREKHEYRSLDASYDDINSGEAKRTGKLEVPCSEIIRTDMKVLSQDQQLDNCNGERQPCPEVLTNGFVVTDSTDPQGVEDLDSIDNTEGLKVISTYNTELDLDSVATTVEDFADFATFSGKQATHVDEISSKVCTDNEREVLDVQESNNINRIRERDSVKEATSDSCEYEGKVCTEVEQVCISKINVMINEDFKTEEDYTTVERDIASSIHRNVTRSSEGKECDTGDKKEHTLFQTNDIVATLNINVSGDQSLSCLPAQEKVHISEIAKNQENGTEDASCSGLNEDDFGDFGAVNNRFLAFADDTHASVSQEQFQIPSENISEISKTSSDFKESDGLQPSTDVAHSQPNEISKTALEECRTADSISSVTPQPLAELDNGDDSEFGDFGSAAKRFPDSDDFSDFSSAGCNQATEWNAFETEQKESCLWATFEDDQAVESCPRKDGWSLHRTGTVSGAEDAVSRTAHSDSVTSIHETDSRHLQELPTTARTVLLSRLERIFVACFPSVPVCEMEEEIAPLNLLLEAGNKPRKTEETLSERELLDVWSELQDIHDAYGLRYQWGGSHSNKKLLCSLGIDTRNILFTGNKKQPVIVPMYAVGLGMLEPTKEPLKPLSAAEKIASIGQTPPVSPEMNICTPDQFQESLPPVQFDWSSSGLTNPLDASGGSTLLNLDFFGPVDDSSSGTTTTIPGVDPELYELTTSKLETSSATSRVTDAFAKLMSTVEKASASARKPKKDEQLSEEAAKVISSLPDLSFMHAKVLMFPATLTPSTSCQGKVD